jgi:enoyl-CoA hydratase/carnithine racemase
MPHASTGRPATEADDATAPRGDSDPAVRVAVDGALMTVTLDAPARRNSQSPATWRALAAVGRDLPDDVRVVILRAEGPSFSAGLDRAMFTPSGIPGEPTLGEIAGLDDRSLDTAIATSRRRSAGGAVTAS